MRFTLQIETSHGRCSARMREQGSSKSVPAELGDYRASARGSLCVRTSTAASSDHPIVAAPFLQANRPVGAIGPRERMGRWSGRDVPADPMKLT
jgi:hypothetical protein